MDHATIRPTKKQRELLAYVSQFIAEHGYSPSYREIMNGLKYTSVATVALHVQNLIKRGHLRKRDYSARSLEVVNLQESAAVTTNQVSPKEEKWLVGKIEHIFRQIEQGSTVSNEQQVHDAQVLVETLHILGLEAAVQSFLPRLSALKK